MCSLSESGKYWDHSGKQLFEIYQSWCELRVLSESGQYWGDMRCQNLNVISTLINGILQSDSGFAS